MARKIFCVTNDAGESMFALADTMLEAVDLWRAENYDAKAEAEGEEQEWPTSCALVYHGTILGSHS